MVFMSLNRSVPERDAVDALLQLHGENPPTSGNTHQEHNNSMQSQPELSELERAVITSLSLMSLQQRILLTFDSPVCATRQVVTIDRGTQTDETVPAEKESNDVIEKLDESQSSAKNVVSSDNEEDDEYNTDAAMDEEHKMFIEEDCNQKYGRKIKDNNLEMTQIGKGGTSVPTRLLRGINWRSYTSATRKLLAAVFSRRVLATHSLTGKPSPAFPNKPAKKKLNPTIVNDIVETVCKNCNVSENIVRTSITTKCADESKMLRSRERNNKRHIRKKKENKPPFASTPEC